MWSTGPLNFEFCKIIESIWNSCGPETVNSKINYVKTLVLRTVLLFSSLKLWHLGRGHNVDTIKIKTSLAAKSQFSTGTLSGDGNLFIIYLLDSMHW